MSSHSGKDLVSTIKWFSNRKGYGFLNAVNGSGDIIIHHAEVVRDVPDEYVQFSEGDLVTFDLEMTTKGAKAVNVRRGGRR